MTLLNELLKYNESIARYGINRDLYRKIKGIESKGKSINPIYTFEELPKKSQYFCSKLNKISTNIESLILENHKELEHSAYKDSLTNLSNRRESCHYIKQKGNGKGKTVVLFDIDHFKNINDTRGHIYGDEVIKTVANVLEKNSRKAELVARWGGEEFMTILNTSKTDVAYKAIDRLRKQIENITEIAGQQISMTISCGLAKNHGEPLEETIKFADEALYIAKNNGRNRVCIHNTKNIEKP